MPRSQAVHLILLVAGGMLCGGCVAGPEFSRERFDTIYFGQEAGQVQKALGPPQRISDGTWEYAKDRPYRQEARIWFKEGRVVRKQWSNPEPPKAETPASRPGAR